MPGSLRKRITVSDIKKLQPNSIIWDAVVAGFGARRQRSEVRTYFLKYRTNGRQRWFKIGRHGSPWTVETARSEAKRLLGSIAEGKDPSANREAVRRDLTVSELCDAYLDAVEGQKKASTIATDRGRIERHIKTRIGKHKVRALTSDDVKGLHNAILTGKTATDIKREGGGRTIVRGGPGAAAKTVILLRAIYKFAIARTLSDSNPAIGINIASDKRKNRFLGADELVSLGKTFSGVSDDWETFKEKKQKGKENPYAMAAIRLLLMTGCRKGEVLSLKWEYVNFEAACLELPDSKTGSKNVTLGEPAIELLKSIPKQDGNDYVFPGKNPGEHLVGLQKIWERVRKVAKLPDVTLHTMRHSYASVGVSGGASLPIIGALLGHKRSTSTERYAHLAKDPKKAMADKISKEISAALNGEQSE